MYFVSGRLLVRRHFLDDFHFCHLDIAPTLLVPLAGIEAKSRTRCFRCGALLLAIYYSLMARNNFVPLIGLDCR